MLKIVSNKDWERVHTEQIFYISVLALFILKLMTIKKGILY